MLPQLALLALACLATALPAAVPLTQLYNNAEIIEQYKVDRASTNFAFSDSQLITTFVTELTSINSYNGSYSNTTDCNRCIKTLQLGKSLAMLRPDLIHPVFTKWCVDSGTDEITCNLTYGRTTVEMDGDGSDFANLLTLMDPNSYDGQLYCYYQGDGACPMPETPKIDLSDRWPAKEAKHMVEPAGSGDTYNVLHLSDFHIQTDFVIGGENNCSSYMCCTSHSVPEEFPPEGYNFTEAMNLTAEQVANLSFYQAYYDDDFNYIKGDEIDVFGNDTVWQPVFTFGQYVCDAPEVLINNSLLSVVKYQQELNIDFDFTIFTGDLVDHDEDKYIDFNKTIASEEAIFRDVKNVLNDLPMYSVLGNHDTFPYAQLAQKKSGFNNLFDYNAKLMSDLWQDYNWLNASTARYAREHYTGFAVTTEKNLKIIALNSNAYYASNLYCYWNATDVDSFGQLQFLIDELLESEANDQRVWIIAHVPMVQEALPVPGEAYRQVIERFSPYTIGATFYGHTHSDQFNILYENGTKEEENAVQVAWISQSITPMVNNNPAWRYYTIDKQSHGIIDSRNYYMRLNDTFVNNSEEPIWEFEYTPREGYPVEWPETAPLNATYWHRVAQAMINNQTVMDTYLNFLRRESPYVFECISGEDTQCLNQDCFVTSFTVDEYNECLIQKGIAPTPL